VPDKRQTSKQRRAARNRAQREALAARRDNVASAPPRPASRASGAGSTGSAAAGGGDARGGRGGLLASLTSRPGDTALLVALALGLGGFLLVPLLPVPVDDRSEPLPIVFKGVALEVRSMLTGQEVEAHNVSRFDAFGPQILLLGALPFLVLVVAFLMNRNRAERSRTLTIAMVAMAAMVFLLQGVAELFLPALIALFFAGYQVRKQELPARMAGGARRRRGRGDVIDVGEVDEDEGERALTPEEMLAELEAEVAAEQAEAAAAEPGQAEGAAEQGQAEDGDAEDAEDGDVEDIEDGDDANDATGSGGTTNRT
jgi:hypothetical protein